jgi:hypothetical protein
MKCKSSSKNFDVPPILEQNLSLGSEMLNRVLRNLRECEETLMKVFIPLIVQKYELKKPLA